MILLAKICQEVRKMKEKKTFIAPCGRTPLVTAASGIDSTIQRVNSSLFFVELVKAWIAWPSDWRWSSHGRWLVTLLCRQLIREWAAIQSWRISFPSLSFSARCMTVSCTPIARPCSFDNSARWIVRSSASWASSSPLCLRISSSCWTFNISLTWSMCAPACRFSCCMNWSDKTFSWIAIYKKKKNNNENVHHSTSEWIVLAYSWFQRISRKIMQQLNNNNLNSVICIWLFFSLSVNNISRFLIPLVYSEYSV